MSNASSSQLSMFNEARICETVPSLIKWTGSKRSQVKVICREIPPFKRYIEPFVGGGAMLYSAAHPEAIAGDLYQPLIELWRMVQSNPHALISDYEKQWLLLNEELDSLANNIHESDRRLPEYYYLVRDRFNQLLRPTDLNFIMRTCVNGIVRFNDKGEFNNSFHLSRRGMEPSRFSRIVLDWHQRLDGVHFHCADYRNTLCLAEEGDFVYLDPPYAGSSNRYISDLQTEAFFDELAKLNNRRVKWALSFDGSRGDQSMLHAVPPSLFKRHLMIGSGLSAVNKVLNGPVEDVRESLYLNF